MEKIFNYYKNILDNDIKEMKFFLFELLDNINYETIDLLIESIFEIDDVTDKYYDYPNKYNFSINNFYLDFDYKKNEVLIQNKEEVKHYLKIDLKTKLLIEIENDDIYISMKKDAILRSIELEKEIKIKIKEISPDLFDGIYIYKQFVTIDDEIKSSLFITLSNYDAILDMDCLIKENDIAVERINTYLNNEKAIKEIKAINKTRHSEKTELLKIFEQKVHSDIEVLIEKTLKKKGIKAINEKKIQRLFLINYEI